MFTYQKVERVMGRKKIVDYYNGSYKGRYLTDDNCRLLDKIIDLDNENGCISDLKDCIYDLSPSEIDTVIETRTSDFLEKKRGTLTDAQTLAVAFMFFSKRVVLGDSVGIGKTVEVAGLYNKVKESRKDSSTPINFLYLTEKNLLEETSKKVMRFTGEYARLLRGEKKYVEEYISELRRGHCPNVVGAHSLINSVPFQDALEEFYDINGYPPFSVLIIDESSIVGNVSTKIYKNAQLLAQDFEYVIVMNATPFEENLRVFYSQLNLCDESFLPTKTEFSKLFEKLDYTGPYPRFRGKYKNEKIFRGLIKYRYFARTRKSLGASMTDCSAEVIAVGLSRLQKDLLKKTSMPQMVYDNPGYYGASIENSCENSPKLGALLDLIEGKLKEEEAIIVYSRYIGAQEAIYDMLSDCGISCAVMNGETSWEDRNDIIERFKQGSIRVLVTNVQKGLDFEHCNCCIFYSYDPNPNKMVQLEGRMTRSQNIIGKKVFLIITKGKELKRFKSTISDKAKASNLFAGSDFSCVLSLLLNEERLIDIE